MPFSRVQWFFWALGLLASTAVILVIGMGKGGPDWYAPVFFIAAGYCALAQAVGTVIRRRGQNQNWAVALSTSRLGLLVLIALAVVAGALLIFRPWR